MAAAESAAAPSLLSVTATQMLMAQIPVKLRMLVQVLDLGGPSRGAFRSGKHRGTGSFARHELLGGFAPCDRRPLQRAHLTFLIGRTTKAPTRAAAPAV